MLKNLTIKSPDRFIEMTVLTLMAMGTVFVFSAGANISVNYDLSHFYSFTTIKQLVFFPLAVLVMYAVSAVDYRRFSLSPSIGRSLSPYLLGVACVLLVLTLIPGIGRGIGPSGTFARRWLDLAPGSVNVSFQPSELAKWALIIFLAGYMAKFADSLGLFWKRFGVN